MVHKTRVSLGIFCSPGFLMKRTENRAMGMLSESKMNDSPSRSVTCHFSHVVLVLSWSATKNKSTCQRPRSSWFELILILSPGNWSWSVSFTHSLTGIAFRGNPPLIPVPSRGKPHLSWRQRRAMVLPTYMQLVGAFPSMFMDIQAFPKDATSHLCKTSSLAAEEASWPVLTHCFKMHSLN